MTRSERLKWAKDRAEEYLKNGDAVNAYASFVSDVNDSPELDISTTLLSGGIHHASSVDAMRHFIQGFN